MKKLHIIYIPGIGSGDYAGQRRSVERWQRYGVSAELFPAHWDEGSWEDKFKQLLDLVDRRVKDGPVALVGVSAGAPAALNVYAARQDKIVGVVCIAGKIQRPENIRDTYRRDAKAFVTSAYDCQKALAQLDGAVRSRIQSRYGLFDEVVTTKDSTIRGAANQRVLSVGHFLTIASQITLGSRGIVQFLQKQAAS